MKRAKRSNLTRKARKEREVHSDKFCRQAK